MALKADEKQLLRDSADLLELLLNEMVWRNVLDQVPDQPPSINDGSLVQSAYSAKICVQRLRELAI